MCCTYYHKQRHLVERFWTLNPAMLPLKLREKVKREDGKNGKEDSMTDVSQNDSHIDADVQTKEGPLKWIGKKWLKFLSN